MKCITNNIRVFWDYLPDQWAAVWSLQVGLLSRIAWKMDFSLIHWCHGNGTAQYTEYQSVLMHRQRDHHICHLPEITNNYVFNNTQIVLS